MIKELILQEYIYARNNEIHAERLEKKIFGEMKRMWTDIALYALACGLRGEEYMRFAEYGFRRIGGKPTESEYLRLKEFKEHNRIKLIKEKL